MSILGSILGDSAKGVVEAVGNVADVLSTTDDERMKNENEAARIANESKKIDTEVVLKNIDRNIAEVNKGGFWNMWHGVLCMTIILTFIFDHFFEPMLAHWGFPFDPNPDANVYDLMRLLLQSAGIQVGSEAVGVARDYVKNKFMR